MNQAKTLLLIVAMTGVLVWIGGMVGGESGMVLALVLGLALNGFSYFFSDRIVLASYGAQVIGPEDAPALHAIVANLAQRAGLPRMILPAANRKDLIDIPKVIKKEMEFIFVEEISEVLLAALVKTRKK